MMIETRFTTVGSITVTGQSRGKMNLSDLNQSRERAFCEAFNIPYPYVPPEPDYSPRRDERKILVLSDPHEPYGAEYVYREALRTDHDAGLVVIPGDMGDYYSKPRFRKTKPGSFRDEVRAVFYRMEWLSVHWPAVKIMLGNHDNRPEKKIQNLLDADPELLIFTEANLLKHLACYFHNVDIVEHQIVNKGMGLTYVWQFGDMIFTHAEISRAQDTATMEFISNWLHTWKGMLGLKPYRFIGQGHNHRNLLTGRDGETWMMFPTCSDPYSLGMEYIWQRMYRKPPAVGYSVLYHDEGVCSPNECHNIVLRSQ